MHRPSTRRNSDRERMSQAEPMVRHVNTTGGGKSLEGKRNSRSQNCSTKDAEETNNHFLCRRRHCLYCDSHFCSSTQTRRVSSAPLACCIAGRNDGDRRPSGEGILDGHLGFTRSAASLYRRPDFRPDEWVPESVAF